VRGLVVLAAALLLSGAAAGAFPGRNGVIAMTRSGAKPQATLVVVDPATGTERELGVGTEPAWSADGERLAFVRDGVVYVAAADGSGAQPVGSGEFPSWSPDGTRLAVSRPDDHGIRQLFVVSLDGNATQLTTGTSAVSLPAWSPNGSTIAFATADSLHAVEADGTGLRTIPTAGARINGGPAWSPDGATLAFVDARDQVWTVAADGGGAHQVTYTLVAPSGSQARPAWAPDGRAIAWTVNADLCITDLAGTVRRLTRTQQSTPSVLASFPDWQPTATGSGTIGEPARGANDTVGCDWNPGVRVELTSLAPSPAGPVVKAPQQVVFVNHTTVPLTIATTMKALRGVVEPGSFLGFDTVPGEYEFAVTGYPDGAARRGTISVPAAGTVAIAAHAPLRYGDRTVLSGTASGPAGAVALWARPAGSARAVQVATVRPSGGRWQVSVAPRISTTYEARFQGATTERLLRVMPALKSRRSGTTVTVTLKPAAALARQPVYLFRMTGRTWAGAGSARLSRAGAAVFRNLAPGRYYVGFEGGDRYWGTAGEPFTVRR
jgi:hypothetical protein